MNCMLDTPTINAPATSAIVNLPEKYSIGKIMRYGVPSYTKYCSKLAAACAALVAAAAASCCHRLSKEAAAYQLMQQHQQQEPTPVLQHRGVQRLLQICTKKATPAHAMLSPELSTPPDTPPVTPVEAHEPTGKPHTRPICCFGTPSFYADQQLKCGVLGTPSTPIRRVFLGPSIQPCSRESLV
jgi:hypothetical protein